MGSTAGGLKMMRGMLVFRHGWQELRKLAHRHDSRGISYNGRAITQDDLGNLWLLFFLFLLAMSFGLLFLSALGLEFHQAMNIAVASITNSGPTAHLMDPDFIGFASLEPSQLLVSVLLMIFGRLEGVLILAMIARNFWDH
jgi:trk system potassium uptake protein TrkH